MALCDELKGLVRTKKRSYYQRLASSPGLVKLVDRDRHHDLLGLGQAVERELIKRIAQIDQTEWVYGVQQTPDALRRGFLMLLGLTADSKYYTAPRRRQKTMETLGTPMSVETWRREPEREFLDILVRELGMKSPEAVPERVVTRHVPIHVKAGQSVYKIVLVIRMN